MQNSFFPVVNHFLKEAFYAHSKIISVRNCKTGILLSHNRRRLFSGKNPFPSSLLINNLLGSKKLNNKKPLDFRVLKEINLQASEEEEDKR